MEGGLAEAGEHRGPLGMPDRGEGKRPLEAGKCSVGVQPKRTLARQNQEPQRRSLELRCMLHLTGGSREVEGGRVVVGEDVCEALDAARGF